MMMVRAVIAVWEDSIGEPEDRVKGARAEDRFSLNVPNRPLHVWINVD